MKLLILAVGKARGPEAAWCAEYAKRLGKNLDIREVGVSKNLSTTESKSAEAALIAQHIPEQAFVVVLDERGRDLTSRDFAANLQTWEERGTSAIVFIIGGADGVADDLKARADFTLGFGRLTWPHKLVRVMLLEQIYRARQINAGHPYHRD